MSWNLFLDVVFAVIVLGSIPVIISLEYYARKARVSAVSSLPWMRSAVLKTLKEQVRNHGLDSNPVIYELGSGWGPLAVDAAKAFPNGKVVGVELSPIPAMVSRIRAWIFGHKNMSVITGDFFKTDFSEADVLLFYMVESILEELRPKMEAELKPGSLVISNSFKIKGWEPVAVTEVMRKPLPLNVYVYRVGSE